MYAVVRTGGKQYLVREGEQFIVEKLEGDEKAKIVLNEVLFAAMSGQHKIGKPLVSGAKVHCILVKQEKGPKLVNFKMRRRKNSRRKKGHRQQLTRLQVEKIEL